MASVVEQRAEMPVDTSTVMISASMDAATRRPGLKLPAPERPGAGRRSMPARNVPAAI